MTGLFGFDGKIDDQLNSLFVNQPKPQKKNVLQLEANAEEEVVVEASADGPETSEGKEALTRKQKLAAVIEKNMRTVFVGNLSRSVIEKQNTAALKKLFGQFGLLECIRFRSIAFDSKMPRKMAFIAKELHSNRETLNAYIVFKDQASANAALSLNGSVFLEKHIRVDVSEQSATKSYDTKKSVFVGNLSFDAEDEHLWDFFADCGEINRVRIVRDRKTNVGKGFAYVQFKERSCVLLALKLNDTELLGRPIRVTRCKAIDSENAASSNPTDKSKSGKKSHSADAKVVEGIRANRNRTSGAHTPKSIKKQKTSGVSKKTKKHSISKSKQSKPKNK